MSFIAEIKASEPSINAVPWDRREFPSPDRSWLAVFHDPYEWHMGATGWQLSVVSSETKSVTNNPDLKQLSNGEGFVCPEDYVPWSANSKTLALLLWKSGLVLFNPLPNEYQVQNSFPRIIQWSQVSDHLLTFRDGQFIIRNSAGTVLTTIDWKTPELEPPHIGWLRSDAIFFVVGRSSKQAKSRIAFIDAQTGTTVSEELLDPEDLVPYDANRYKHIPRDRHSLILSSSSQSSSRVGHLLDVWDDVIYEQDKGIILLSTYRPVNKLFASRDARVCQVKKKWISVKLYG